MNFVHPGGASSKPICEEKKVPGLLCIAFVMYDDNWAMKACFFILSVLFTLSTSRPTRAATIQYISPSQQHLFEELFKEGRFSVLDNQRQLTRSRWLCDLFGAQSRLQVEHGLHLYRFTPAGHGDWINKGSQVVSHYRVKNEMLIGQATRFKDSLRITRDGRLISKLTTSSQGGERVVAYSLCHSLTE
jgi:hypothetical protein